MMSGYSNVGQFRQALIYKTSYMLDCNALGLACQAFALDSRTEVWCTTLVWSADLGKRWRGGSTKYRKAVGISTPFYFHRVAFRATGLRLDCYWS